MATTLTFDKPSYTAGDTMTATVTTDAGARTIYQDVTGTLAIDFPGHPELNQSGTYTTQTATGGFVQPTVTDSLGKAWTVASDDGTTLVLTATA